MPILHPTLAINKLIRVLFLFFFVPIVTLSQKTSLKWAYDFGRKGTSQGVGFCKEDNYGNVYSVGTFSDSVDFDPDSTQKFLFAKSKQGFIQKLDKRGKLIWVKQTIGIDTFSFASFSHISFTSKGELIVIGGFHDTVDFNHGASSFFMHTSGKSLAICILKLDTSGNLIWAKSIEGNATQSVFSLTIDSFNGIYISGLFTDTVDFDPGTGIHELHSRKIKTSTPPFYKFETESFFMKLDTSGNFKWVKGLGYDTLTSVIIPSLIAEKNIIYGTGQFTGNVDFDPPNKKYLNSGGSTTFIFKTDTSGKLIWVKNVGGQGFCIKTDNNKNILVTGGFAGKRDFDPSSSNYFLNSKTNGNKFILKLDSSGKFIWAEAYGSKSLYYTSNLISTDILNNVFSSGSFNDTGDYLPDTFNLTSYKLFPNGKYDVYISKLDSSGKFKWAKSFGGVGNEGINGISTIKGDIYLAGSFQQTLDFDPEKTSSKKWTYTASGTSDIFITHHIDCIPYQSPAIKLNGCDSIVFNGKIYKTTGKYFQKYLNVEGCDSFINIDVTVNTKPKSKFNSTTECFGKANQFTDSSTNSTKHVWFFGDGDTSTANNPTHTYKIAGSFKATLAVMSSAGCVDSSSQTVTVNPNPVATFITAANGAKTYDFLATDTTQTSYSWNFGDGANATGFVTSHTYTKDSTFIVSLSVTNSFGCTDKKDSNLSVITGFISITENNFSASIYPNPFKESTNIRYSITQKNHVKIYITDVLGRTVCTLADANQNAGEYNIDVPRFGNVARLGMSQGGVYFVHFIVGDRRVVERVVMVK